MWATRYRRAAPAGSVRSISANISSFGEQEHAPLAAVALDLSEQEDARSARIGEQSLLDLDQRLARHR